jgi:uncharacterized protein YbaP (TraB family)
MMDSLKYARGFLLGLGLIWLTSASPAVADDSPSGPGPAFWTVHGPTGTAYILGSVHALPPGVTWRSKQIDAAAKASDTYIFEVPNGLADEAEATRFIRARGVLSEGKTLHEMLSPVAQKDYVAACALAGMNATSIDDKKPWLAAVVLTVSYMNQRQLTFMNTPDEDYLKTALRYGKTLRYFDTTREQLEFLARFDDTMGVAGFSTMLGDFTKQPEREDALISAWRSGDTTRMAGLIADSFKTDVAGARLLADHNLSWTRQLEALLDTGRTYFVVVGVAHLVGPSGMPSMLRADGYTVEGP